MPGISKGILFKIWHALLKEWGLASLGILLEDTMQELLTEVTFNFSIFFIFQFLTTPIQLFFYLSLPVLLF